MHIYLNEEKGASVSVCRELHIIGVMRSASSRGIEDLVQIEDNNVLEMKCSFEDLAESETKQCGEAEAQNYFFSDCPPPLVEIVPLSTAKAAMEINDDNMVLSVVGSSPSFTCSVRNIDLLHNEEKMVDSNSRSSNFMQEAFHFLRRINNEQQHDMQIMPYLTFPNFPGSSVQQVSPAGASMNSSVDVIDDCSPQQDESYVKFMESPPVSINYLTDAGRQHQSKQQESSASCVINPQPEPGQPHHGDRGYSQKKLKGRIASLKNTKRGFESKDSASIQQSYSKKRNVFNNSHQATTNSSKVDGERNGASSSSSNLQPRAKQGTASDSQSIAARQRRERISGRLKILQSLVPNGSKVDLVTMLEKAINYVKFLQLQIQVLTNDEIWPNQDRSSVSVVENNNDVAEPENKDEK